MGWLSALFGPRENPKEWVAQGAKIIDVRQPTEFQCSHVKGAKNIPLDQLSVKIGKVTQSKDDALVLCCRSGARSSAAKRMLKRQGYTKLLNAGPWTTLKTLFLALTLSTTVACAQSAEGEAGNSSNLNVTQFEQAQSGTEAIVVDIRTAGEWEAGVIDGAILIDFYDPEFLAKVKTLDTSGGLLLYCRSGNRSGQAIQMLQRAGIENVRHLSGGIMAWERAGNRLAYPD